MTEMIVLDNPLEFINDAWLLIGLIFAIAVAMLVINYFIRYRHVKKRVYFSILITFVLVVIFAVLNDRVSLTYDYLFDKKSETEINFTELKYTNRTLYYQDDKTKYVFFIIGRPEKEDLLNKYFVGKECAITYYTSSKAVIDIKALD